jgi:hypothetical protein
MIIHPQNYVYNRLLSDFQLGLLARKSAV